MFRPIFYAWTTYARISGAYVDELIRSPSPVQTVRAPVRAPVIANMFLHLPGLVGEPEKG